MKRILIPILLVTLGHSACKLDSEKSQNAETASAPIKGEVVNPREEWAPLTVPIPEPEGQLFLGPDAVTNVLNHNDELTLGQSLKSPDGRFTAAFQSDSNFVIYFRGTPIWASNTFNSGGNRVVFQGDGNLVMYTAAGAPIWGSGTWGKGAVRTVLNNDGSLAVYNAAGVVLWTSGTGGYPLAVPPDTRPVAVGKWGPLIPWPIIPIHTVLLPTGKVFSFGTNADGAQGAQFNYDIWTPSSGTDAASHALLPNSQNTDIFCGAPIVIPATGNVLIPGGDTRQPVANRGIKDTFILDKDNQTLSRGPFLNAARWYQTSTTLPNGEILTHGGIDGGGAIVITPEVYNPADNTWRTLMGASNPAILNGGDAKWWYPRNWVAPDGRVFGMSGDHMYFINTTGSGSAQVAGPLPPLSRSYTSSAVMYSPGKIVQMGGWINGNLGGRGSDAAIHVDINGPGPVVTKLSSMAFERQWVSATVLPSGEVLATGGSPYDNQLQEVALTAELWNPETKTFRPLLQASTPRLYHSTAMLLPDATVLTAGGGAPGPQINKNAEIYYPPYLFDANGNPATRPVITDVAAALDYNVATPVTVSGEPISKVVLIKTGAVTHSSDMDQRLIPLTFTTAGNTLSVRFPLNANIAPPGYYHLFVLNAQGVPSVSKIVSLGAKKAPAIGDTLPAGSSLALGDSLRSADGRHTMTFQLDGNLVVAAGARPIWASGTFNKGAVVVHMQTDGNLVMYTANQTPIWSSQTFGPQFAGARLVLENGGNLVILKGNQAVWATRNVLLPGETLRHNESIRSADGRHLLVFQSDGHLVLYFQAQPVWGSGTYNKGAERVEMQPDGNLVIYTANAPIWSSNTFGGAFSGSQLTLKNDGNVILHKGGTTHWSTNTCCR